MYILSSSWQLGVDYLCMWTLNHIVSIGDDDEESFEHCPVRQSVQERILMRIRKPSSEAQTDFAYFTRVLERAEVFSKGKAESCYSFDHVIRIYVNIIMNVECYRTDGKIHHE